MKIFLPETEENTEKLEKAPLQADYIGREKAYRVKFFSKEEYDEHKELLKKLILSAMAMQNSWCVQCCSNEARYSETD